MKADLHVFNRMIKGVTALYPTRTERKRALDREKEQRRARFWAILNTGLIILITAMFVYYFTASDQTPQGSEPTSYILNTGSEEQLPLRFTD